VAILAAAHLISPSLPALEDPGERWRDGPVQYLLKRSEYRRYGRQKTPAARKLFVDRFWKRLDPDPSTPLNEFRDRFKYLADLADERFRDALGPGWRTDRGRVLILLGVPDSIRRAPGNALAADREIWTYERLRGRKALPLEVVFFRGAAGEYRLRPDERVEDQLQKRDWTERLRAAQWAAHSTRWGTSALRPFFEYEVLRDAVAPHDQTSSFDVFPAPRAGGTISPRSRVPALPGPLADGLSTGLDDQAFFFRAADGSVLTLLTLEFDPEAGEEPRDAEGGEENVDYAAVAWVFDGSRRNGDENGSRARAVTLQQERERAGDGRLLFGGHLYLTPGDHQLRYALQDPSRDRLLVRSRTLRVPELGRVGFSASSVVPAEWFGPSRDDAFTPFAVGSDQVIPRPGGAFYRGEPLRIYLQVYGATPDPESGTAKVDVRIRFERSTRYRMRTIGRPFSIRGAQGASVGLALPVGDWPAGDYRVIVDLRDRVSGARTFTEGTFRIVDD
jgi:GWxTD domain-containing protein